VAKRPNQKKGTNFKPKIEVDERKRSEEMNGRKHEFNNSKEQSKTTDTRP
jgi:hypothetical protein